MRRMLVLSTAVRSFLHDIAAQMGVRSSPDRRSTERAICIRCKQLPRAHGLQCGFCTPGMIMSTADLLKQNPNPTEPEIRIWLQGNICRCTGYHNIVKAVQIAAAQMSGRAVAAE